MSESITVKIKDVEITRIVSFSLSQCIYEHHVFRLICSAETLNDALGNTIYCTKNIIGEDIEVWINGEGVAVGLYGYSVGSIPGPCMCFKGVVTQVEAAHYNGHSGDIIVNGASKTILTDNGLYCKTWENKTLKDIVEDVLQGFPQNVWELKVKSAHTQKIPYVIQYKETAWQFLNRLSAVYGQWFLYNGTELLFGDPYDDYDELLDRASLVFGSDLSRFNIEVHSRPAKFQLTGYDYTQDQSYKSVPDGIADIAGLNEPGKLALQKSEKLYSSRTQPNQWTNNYLTGKKQLDDMVNTYAAMQSSDLVRFNGSSDCVKLRLGYPVRIMANKMLNKEKVYDSTGYPEQESIGDFTVLLINHYFDGQGSYTNDFVAIPHSVKLPPLPAVGVPYCETQSAKITDNHDEKGLGRVRAKFHWMAEGEKTPWMRIASPHGGGNKGMFFIPEIGEEVIVGFEGDNPESPYVIGTVYNGKANASGIGTEKNDIKQLKTRSGHTLKFDDVKDGSITILTSGGHTIVMNDKDKTISITGTEHLKITTKESISLHSKKIDLQAEEISLDASKFIGMKGKNKVELHSDDKVLISGNNTLNGSSKNVEINAENDLNLKSGKSANMQSKTTNVKGNRVNIN